MPLLLLLLHLRLLDQLSLESSELQVAPFLLPLLLQSLLPLLLQSLLL